MTRGLEQKQQKIPFISHIFFVIFPYYYYKKKQLYVLYLYKHGMPPWPGCWRVFSQLFLWVLLLWECLILILVIIPPYRDHQSASQRCLHMCLSTAWCEYQLHLSPFMLVGLLPPAGLQPSVGTATAKIILEERSFYHFYHRLFDL